MSSPSLAASGHPLSSTPATTTILTQPATSNIPTHHLSSSESDYQKGFHLDPSLISDMSTPNAPLESIPYRTNLDLLVNAISESDTTSRKPGDGSPQAQGAANLGDENPLNRGHNHGSSQDDTRMRSLLAASLAVGPANLAGSSAHSNGSHDEFQSNTYNKETSGKRKRNAEGGDNEDYEVKQFADANRRRIADPPRARPGDIPPTAMTTVTCLHAAVAQKSYGHEKRFLCPPPLVRIDSPIRSISEQRLTMSVVTEDGARLAEQSSTIDEQLQFKYLHVGGASTKSKSFHLSLEISGPIPAPSHEPSSAVPALRTWASFESAPVTIISKPSKKTAKTRNVSTCIMDGSSISLFNRINSQTVRTKYMTVDRAELAASNASWSAFRVQILDDEHGNPIDPSQSLAGASRNGPPPQRPIHYGSRIVLTDEATGISSEPLIVRKVDKGKLSRSDTGGLVSQMQKVALQRASTNSDMPSPTGLFLSAGRLPLPVHAADRSSISMSTSHATPDGKAIASAHPLTYQAPRSTGNAGGVDEVDDFLCWTVVGIAEYHYTFFDASTTHPPSIVPHRPITPFPVSANVPALPPSVNRLELDVFNFYSPDPITGAPIPMEVWIGTVGPLTVRIQPASTPPYNAQFDMTGHSLGPVDSHAGPSLSHGQDPGATPNLAMHRVPPNLTSISVDLPTPQDVLNAIMQRDADGLTIPGPTRARGSGSPSSSSPAPSGSRPAPGTHSASFPVRESDAMPFSPALSGRSLPIFFVRPYDRVGYMSGYSLACESIYAGPLPHGTGAEASQPAAWGFRVI